jgi:hypothetical protein
MGLHLGSTPPDFEQDSSEGKLKSTSGSATSSPCRRAGTAENPPRQDGEPPVARLGRGIRGC